MLKKILPVISSIVLIAIFVVLFKLSLSEVGINVLEAKSRSRLHKEVDAFFSQLSSNEKTALASLPCVNPQQCGDINEIKAKFLKAFPKEVADRAFILTEGGVEVFTGQQLSQTYSSLITAAKSTGENFYLEKSVSNSADKTRVIIVKRISDIISGASFRDKYMFILLENRSPGIVDYLPFALMVILPALFIFFVFYKKYKSNKDKRIVLEGQIEKNKEEVEKLKKENVQQSQFLANFTHELRTPLNSIIGFSGLIKDETMGPIGSQEYVKYANDINTSGLHLLGLINDILDYSKSEVGRLKVNITEVDVIKIIKQCLSIVAPRASESKVDLLQSFSADYFVVKLDPKRFKQIVLNLLSNSVKFTPEGGNVKVSAFTDLQGEKLFIEVKDTGVGIAEKDIPTAMSLFGQIETSLNRKYEGTGIGLPFAKKLTNLMGGSFELTSVLGAGTSVMITLPYDKKLNAEYAELYKKSGAEA